MAILELYRSWNLIIAVLDCTQWFASAVCLMNKIVFSVDMCYRKVVDNFIILLVLKFDSYRSDSLGIMLFTNSVTESVQILYRFQKLHCLLKLMLESVLVDYKKVVEAFLILLVIQFQNHRTDSLRVMDFTNCLLCSVLCQNRFQKL